MTYLGDAGAEMGLPCEALSVVDMVGSAKCSDPDKFASDLRRMLDISTAL